MDMAVIPWEMVLLCGLSLCVGWGIRGNFGHEYGAALPGALAAIAIVLLSGREDWWRHVHYFALFGAIGWSFGGSMSYMMVVGYSHSSQSPTVLYGFANLFAIGFFVGSSWGCGYRAASVFNAYAAIPVLRADRCCVYWLVAPSGDYRSRACTETHAATRESALLVRYGLGVRTGSDSRCPHCRALPWRFGHGHKSRPISRHLLVRRVLIIGKRLSAAYDTPAWGQLGGLCRYGYRDLRLLLTL